MPRTALSPFLLMAAMTLSAAVPASPQPPLPRQTRLEGYGTLSEVEKRMASLPLHPVEGIWEFPADGGLVAVERCELTSGAPRQYRMVVISVANRALLPGTVLGSFRATSQAGVYDGEFFTSVSANGMTPASPRSVTLEFDAASSRLAMRRNRRGLRLNLWRLVPYVFRFSVTHRDDSPRNLDGWIRVYPPPAIPAEPRYL